MAGKILKKKPVKPIIIVIGRDHLQACGPDSSQPVTLSLTGELMVDLDVVNPALFIQKIADFLTDNKFRPAPVIIIFLDTIYFEKNYTGTASPSPDDIQQYLDTIPLSSISYKVFHTADGYKLIVINQDLYETLKKAFESREFPIQAVIPGFALNLINVPQELTAQSCLLISKKTEFLIENSFTAPSANQGDFHQKEQAFLQKHTAMVAILSIMFISTALIVAFLTLNKPKSQLVKVVSRAMPTPVVTLAPEPTEAPASVSADLLSSLSVRVVNSSGRAGLAASLAAQLKEEGLPKVTVQTSAVIAGTPFVVYSPETPQQVVKFVYDIVLRLYPSAVLRSQNDIPAGVTVTLTK